MSTLCSQCGFDNPPGMRFCGNCGARLAEVAPPPASTGMLPSFNPERLGVMMGPDLLERFRQAGLEAVGQRRNVTVLFADLSGYTSLSEQLDNEDVFDFLQQYLKRLANAVYKYEGTVDKFTGDGLMALFGAPIAHENHAELAVRSAQEMQIEVARLGQQLSNRLGTEPRAHIGLHTGSVIVGSVGSNTMMNYTAVGDTVNLARRLEEATAPGKTLVSEAVYRLTKPLFDYEAVPPLKLKGIAQPVAGYLVVGSKTSPGSVRGVEGLHAPLVGRETELNRLTQAAQALTRQGVGQIILLTGNAGLGKSRLTAEFKAIVKQAGAQVLEGHSLTYRRSVAYWVFLDVLRDYLNIAPDAPETQVREALSQRTHAGLGSKASDTLPYLEHLLGLKPADAGFAAERIQYLEPSQLRQQIFLAVRDLLVAEARRHPLALILEDLHWADEVSLDLLLFLLDSTRQAPLLIYAISRPIEGGALGKIVEHAGKRLADRFTPLHLRSLSPDQSEQLLSQLLAIPDLPERLRDQILQRAAGIPFYLEEILRMLIDAGMLRRDSGRWRLAPGVDLATLGVPDTLRDLILARFDRLDQTERRLLQVASIIGQNFGWPLLKAVIQPVDEPACRAALALLVEREFVVPQAEAADREYTFKHALVSDAIYGTLLRRDRNELHGQVGGAIEMLYADQLDGQVELLASHYLHSPRPDRALHYLLLAGQKSARGYANAQARQYYDQALALLPQVPHDLPQTLQAHVGLGDVMVLTGEYPAARAHYETALEAISTEDTLAYAGERSALQRKAGMTFEAQGSYDEALLCLEAAQGTLEKMPAPMPVGWARILNDTGWILFRRGNHEDAENYLLQALSLAKDLPHADVIASIYNRLGGVAYKKDELEQASHYVRKSLELREAIGDIVGVARLHNNLGLLAYTRGEWGRALEHYKQNLELQTRIGDAEALAFSSLNLAVLQIDLGDLDDAQANVERSLEASRQIGALFHIAAAQTHFGRLWLSRQDWERALQHLEESFRIFTEIGAQENLVDIYHLIGEAHFGLGNLAAAADWAQRSIDLIMQMGSRVLGKSDEHGRALRLLGRVALAEGDWSAADRDLHKSAAMFQITGTRLEQGRTLVELGRLALERGDSGAARQSLQDAHRIFQELGAKMDEHLAAKLLA